MPHCRRHALSPFHPSFLSVRARIRVVQVVGGMRMPRVSIPHSKLRRLHRGETADAICRGPLSGATLVDLEVKRGKREKVKKNKKIKNNPYERAAEMRGHCRDGVHDPWKSGCTRKPRHSSSSSSFSCLAIDTRFVEKRKRDTLVRQVPFGGRELIDYRLRKIERRDLYPRE